MSGISSGLSITRSKIQNLGLKTPDFKVFRADAEKLLCEVKAVTPGQDRAVTSDPIPNRLTNDIHDGYKKFCDANPNHALPNVLAFVNYDISGGVDYLEDVLLGKWFMEGGTVLPFYRKHAEGRIKHEKRFIDLYLWFEWDKIFFRFTGTQQKHFVELCNLFGLSAGNIATIGA